MLEGRRNRPARFGEFRLDHTDGRLWRADEIVPLRPKAYAMLSYFVEHPGRLISKQELLDELWPETYTSDAVVKTCMRELRRALGDSVNDPAYVETQHGRGYRFVAEVSYEDAQAPTARVRALDPKAPVGRQRELDRAAGWLRLAADTRRRTAIVSGEHGIGKTTFVDAMCEAARALGFCPAVGGCAEQLGEREPYLPVLAALGGVARGPHRDLLRRTLEQYAPSWLPHLPSLLPMADRSGPQADGMAGTPARMMREMAEALETLSSEIPLLFVVEDLHWADRSTLDLLSYLARRHNPCRLLVVVTARSGEGDPTVARALRDLLALGCERLELRLFDVAAIADYVGAALGEAGAPQRLVEMLHMRTEGNPLFCANLMNHLRENGSLRESGSGWHFDSERAEGTGGVPASLTALIERRLEGLDEHEQRLVAAASVCGSSWLCTTVAAALELDPVAVEQRCGELARGGMFIRPLEDVVLPCGEVTTRYAFVHVLYREVLERSIAATARAKMHLRAAAELERTFAREADDVAAELARHREQAADFPGAVRWLRRAAEASASRAANPEAQKTLERALDLSSRGRVDASVVRRIRSQLASVCLAMGELAAAAESLGEVARLAADEGDGEAEVRALLHLNSVYGRYDRARCVQTGQRAVERARLVENEPLRIVARAHLAYWRLVVERWSTEDVELVRAGLEAARELGDDRILGITLGRGAFVLAMSSEYAAAAGHAHEAAKLASSAGDAYEYLVCCSFGIWARILGGDWGGALSLSADCSRRALDNGDTVWARGFRLVDGVLHLQTGALHRAREAAEAALLADQSLTELPSLLLESILAAALTGLGDLDGAAEALEKSERAAQAIGMSREWGFRLPTNHIRSAHALAAGDLDRAESLARSVLEAASSFGERTWQVLALLQLAGVADRRGDAGDARARREAALDIVGSGHELPLAAWRALAGAGDPEAAASVLEGLVSSLEGHEAVRRDLLASKAARAVRLQLDR